jgi:hypothetical protein
MDDDTAQPDLMGADEIADGADAELLVKATDDKHEAGGENIK